MSSRTGYKFEIYYSPTSRVLTFVGVLVALVASSRWLLVLIVPRLRKAKWLWFAISMAAYTLGVSGTIFVYLRGMPNKGKDGYFAGDRNQFAFEGYIIGAILLASSASLVLSAYGRIPAVVPGPVNAVFKNVLHLCCILGFGALFKLYMYAPRIYTSACVIWD